MTADYRLDDQAGIIVGAAGGIGGALTVGLAAAGADVVVADLGSQRVGSAATAAAVRALGRRALVVDLDVTSLSSIQSAVQRTIEEFHRVDFLVNCAGINIRKPVLEYTEQEWDRIIDVNLKGVFFCTQVVTREMVRAGHGKVVTIASQLASVVMRDRSVYAISKAGVAHMTRAFALELGPQGITVNAVGPTFVATPLTTSMFTDDAFVSENLPQIPSGRFGTADDVLGAVQYLLSHAADLVNGHLLIVDGGYTIH